MRPTSSLTAVVMMQKVRSHSPVDRSFQFSHSPTNPNGERYFMAMA